MNYYGKEPNAQIASMFSSGDPTNNGTKSFEGIIANQTKQPLQSEALTPDKTSSHSNELTVENFSAAVTPKQIGRPSGQDISVQAKEQALLKSVTPAPINNISNAIYLDNLSSADKKYLIGKNYGLVSSSKKSGSYAGLSVDYGVKFEDFLGAISIMDTNAYNQIATTQKDLMARGIDPAENPQFQEMIGTMKEAVYGSLGEIVTSTLNTKGNYAYSDPNFVKLKNTYDGLNGFDSIKGLDGGEANNVMSVYNQKEQDKYNAMGFLDPRYISKDLSKEPSINSKTKLLGNSAFKTFLNTFLASPDAAGIKDKVLESLKSPELTQTDKDVLYRLDEIMVRDGIREKINAAKGNPNKEKLIPQVYRDLDEAFKLVFASRETDLLDHLTANISIPDIFGKNVASSPVNTYNAGVGTARFL